jgi:hypothetical protein
MLERLARVALEHLERHDDLVATPRQPLQDGQLQAMRVDVVMLFAHEHDVGAGEVGEHHLEVGEGAAGVVEHAVRHVHALRGGQGEHGSKQEPEHG